MLSLFRPESGNDWAYFYCNNSNKIQRAPQLWRKSMKSKWIVYAQSWLLYLFGEFSRNIPRRCIDSVHNSQVEQNIQILSVSVTTEGKNIDPRRLRNILLKKNYLPDRKCRKTRSAPGKCPVASCQDWFRWSLQRLQKELLNCWCVSPKRIFWRKLLRAKKDEININ